MTYEEQQGYLARQEGRALASNPHPRLTIMWLAWGRGWFACLKEEMEKGTFNGYHTRKDRDPTAS